MTDDQLDQHLRAWYRAEIGDVGPAPPSLYASVAGIPDATPAPIGSRRSWILLAAATMLLALFIGAAVAIGSGLLRLPWVVDDELPLVAAESGAPSPSAAASAERSASPTPVAGACGDMDNVAAELGAVSGRGWPGPASPAGSPTEARPGLLAGWDGGVVLLDPLSGSETPILPRFNADALAWSPDGGALAIAGCELWVMVGDDVYRPAPGLQIETLDWSPDSTRLAVVISDRAGDSVHIIPRDGGPIVDLSGPCQSCWIGNRALWSPDGSRLAVQYIVNTDLPEAQAPDQWGGVAFADADGGGWRLQPMPSLSIGFVSDWLDDRHLLAGGSRGDVFGWFSISVDDPDDVRPVDDPGNPSPDGSKLALVSWTQTDEAFDPIAVDYEVTVVDVASGERRVIWSDKSELVNALWAPDSATLAITTHSESIFNRGVWIVNPDGSEPRHVRDQPLELMDWQPLWP